MEFKNGYNFMYQKLKTIYASKIGRPGVEDAAVDFGLTEEEIKNIKLVYENKDGLIVNFTGLPTVDDKSIQATINGEPVIGPSGDNPKPPTPSLTPIEIGQHLVEGTKIHFDISQEDSFLPMLKSLNYEDWQNGLQKSVLASVGTEADEERKLDWLWAMKIPKELVQTEEDIYLLSLGDSNSDGHPIYLSMYVPGMSGVVVGFNNLDANGDFTMSVDSGYYIVNGLYGNGWNGILIGMAEEPTPGLTSFELGQTVKGFDFGNVSNGDANADLDAFLLALEPGSEALMVSSDDYEQLLLCGRFEGRDGQPSAGIVMDNATGTFLYATDDYYEQGEKVCSKGYQNLTDGKYILPGDITFEVAHMNEGLEDTSWNGRLVGAVLGEPGPTPPVPPTPVTPYPFYLGEVLTNGQKIYIDKSKEAELLDMLNNIPAYGLLLNTTYTRWVLIAMDASAMASGATGKVLLCGNMAGNAPTIIYATEAGSNPETGLSWEAGWNIDSNEIIVDLPTDTVVINDINTDITGWNGTIIYQVEGPEPPAPELTPFGLYDIITDGFTIKCDKSTGEDLATYVDNIRKSGAFLDTYNLLEYDKNEGLMVLEDHSYYYLIKVAGKVIFSSIESGGYQKYFNNVDSFGNFTVDLSSLGLDSVSIININNPDISGTTWNGTMMGK